MILRKIMGVVSMAMRAARCQPEFGLGMPNSADRAVESLMGLLS
jgi:hypothetical protein